MAYNPNAVFISPSSLADFDKCPRLYYFRYVYKSPETGLKIQIINPALALGQAVHDTIEKFTSLEPGERTEQGLKDTFKQVWQGVSGEKGGFANPEEEAQFRQRGEAMLKTFFNHSHFKKTKKEKLPDFPKVDLADDIILTGKLDWVEKEDGVYHVIDFKTGQKEEREDSIQLPVYALLVSKIFQNDNVKTSYWYIDHDLDLRSFPLPVMEEFAQDIKKRGLIIKKVRLTNSFVCQSGNQSCWACRDIQAVASGKGKLVSVDMTRKQEIYILPREKPTDKEATESDLPF